MITVVAMELKTLKQIRHAAQNGSGVEARVHVQVEAAAAKVTREQKPYCELALADAADRMTLRVWSDHPSYRACGSLDREDFIELSGEFYQHPQYGLEAKRWDVRALTAEEQQHLLQGPPELREKQRADWDFIVGATQQIRDPRLRALCAAFLDDYGARFRRSAGARSYHHARRGGLVEHTAQMMRVAREIAPLYPQLNSELLVAGILFHDSGKLWENHLPENGFTMSFDERGELLGHISIGLELVNTIWRKLESSDAARSWEPLSPASEDVRLHLLHLIGAHHGEPQFGSPVSPKTPEAMALNYIDNLDARMEMFAAGYLVAKPIAERIFDRVRPLPGNLVQPLSRFEAPRPDTANGDRETGTLL
ncbi:MAG: HD domain-containing protein [Verrucomicrobiota bacterium]|nr:HD domain-containing protein [Verrucomicrobiota bacterium]